MSSNKIFRAAKLMQCSEIIPSASRIPAHSQYWYSQNSRKPIQNSASTSNDSLLRVRHELYSTLNLHLKQMESLKLPRSNSPAIRLIEFEEEHLLGSPSTSTTSATNYTQLSKEDQKAAALRERFRSRLHTYLQACVLAAFRPGINSSSKTARRRQIGYYLDAAYGALRHYNACIDGRSPKRHISLDDPELFNTVLFGLIHGATELGEWKLVTADRSVDGRDYALKLWELIRKRAVKPNEGTLAAYYLLHHLHDDIRGRMKDAYQDKISTIIKQLNASVVQDGTISQDQRLNENDRELLEGLIKWPKSVGAFISPNEARYGRGLLKSLNEPYLKGYASDSSSKDGPYASVFGDEKKQELMDDFQAQLDREKRGIVEIPSSFVDPYAPKTVYDQVIDGVHELWKRRLTRSFEERKRRYVRVLQERMTFGGPDSFKISIAPFLCLSEPDTYVNVMLDEAICLSRMAGNQGVPLKVLCPKLGNRLITRIKIELADKHGLVDKITDVYKDYLNYFIHWNGCNVYNHREFWLQIAQKLFPSNPNCYFDRLNCDNAWLLYELGEFLYEIMIDSLKVPASLAKATTRSRTEKTRLEDLVLVDAFFKAMSSYGVKQYEEVRAHPNLAELHKKSVPRIIRFDALEVPLVCPPIPWHKHDRGQLLVTPVDLVRLEPNGARSLQNTQCIRSKHEDVKPVLDALNILGSTPWIINKPILDIMLDIFRGDGDMKLTIPPSQGKLPKVTEFPPRKMQISQEERLALMRKRQAEKKTHMEIYSLWCTAHYRFSLAEYLKDKIIWFPHNVDFRGRTYPVPPVLNHMGDDVCRGMMQFAEGRPLGEHGLYWLKVHLINLTGLKKRSSVDERAKYAEEILEDILDSAKDPMGGKRWWMKSEEPWQTLATCMEIEKALRTEKLEEYVCHLPVHQDGSCNGLQHYAALGRDQQGATQVNLEPSMTPQDVYSAVAAKIEEKRARDAESGLEIAEVLDGYVRRKVIKQTVMTTVYGVTRYGGRGQIMRQLKDIEEFPEEHAFQASLYLVERLFESIGEIFSAARHIQDWFVKSSSLISGKMGRTVEWITPMGFPVAQPYFKCLNSCRSFAAEDKLSEASSRPFPINYIEVPNTYKQRNAFPPNYIHSLDSTHMMLTALHCHRQGIAYAAVHDSFWTHPSTITDMNAVCREQFVALHSQPLLQQLSDFFIHHYVEPELAKLRKMKGNRDTERRLAELETIREHFMSLPRLGTENGLPCLDP